MLETAAQMQLKFPVFSEDGRIGMTRYHSHTQASCAERGGGCAPVNNTITRIPTPAHDGGARIFVPAAKY
ncbi:MAG: hypothetical protein IJR28_04055 [Ottowia sp.]|nr:hypothetical protein [Ottowia sp.]